MIYRIKSGKHRAWPPKLGLWFNKTTITHKVMFFDDCRYSIPGEDMFDTNKLFGVGYFWNHHEDSARFGWRYNPASDKIVLSAYCYVSGERVMQDIVEVAIGKQIVCVLKVIKSNYLFVVNYIDEKQNWETESATVSFTHKKKWAYPLNPYFGGNEPAPHDIHIQLR